MKLPILYLLFIALASCKSHVVSDNSVCLCEPIVFTGDSVYYNSIVPPRPIADSNRIYEELANRLHFANKLKWTGGTNWSDWWILINENGRVNLKSMQYSSKRISNNMPEVMAYVADGLKEWEPAYDKRNADKKVPFDVHLTFYFYKDTILFKAMDLEGHDLLRKSFRRPIRKGKKD